MVGRREFLCILATGIIYFRKVPMAWSQSLSPLALRLVRRTGWEQLMGRNKCVVGDLYISSPQFPVSDRGTKICQALELAWRKNINEISAVPKGEYGGFVRTDGPRGWRIELDGTGERKNIQIHVGNRPKDTFGCLLPGTGNSTDALCDIAGSKDAMNLLKTAYGNSTTRSVVLRIE
jgi:hypothetical protein